jgi:hypothetical protein
VGLAGVVVDWGSLTLTKGISMLRRTWGGDRGASPISLSALLGCRLSVSISLPGVRGTSGVETTPNDLLAEPLADSPAGPCPLS